MIIEDFSSEKGMYSEAAEFESSQEEKKMGEPRESDLQNDDTTMTTRQPAQSEQNNEDDENEEDDDSDEQTVLQDVNTGANVNNKITLEA